MPAQRFVSRPDTAWIGRGTAFGPPTAQRRCTLLVVWYAEQEEPWIILTDLAPDKVGPSWYALRFWIELGFKAIKSLGWKWDKTRRTDPARVSRHWLVLSVATLLALAYGTRVEDAHDRRIAPGSLRAPPRVGAALLSAAFCPMAGPLSIHREFPAVSVFLLRSDSPPSTGRPVRFRASR